MYKVLIADDEVRIRRGLKKVVDWEKLGYSICAEAANGEEAYRHIMESSPDVVLLDIRMPKISGMEAIRRAKEKGYKGVIIVLSGYSDFEYAQQAISLGVQHYLTKPINEQELEKILIELRSRFHEQERENRAQIRHSRRARESVLKDLLLNPANIDAIDIENLNRSTSYQVIICEQYSPGTTYHPKSFTMFTQIKEDDCEKTFINQAEVILLCSERAIQKMASVIKDTGHGSKIAGNTALNEIFLSCGKVVSSLSDIYLSYDEAKNVSLRRFFCDPEQHIISYEQLPEAYYDFLQPDDLLTRCKDNITENIAAFKSERVGEALLQIEDLLCHGNYGTDPVKYFLIDLFICVKETIAQRYNDTSLPFPANSQVMDYIISCKYLREIIRFMSEQFCTAIDCIGSYSRDSILDDVVSYIDHNYMKNIKLEDIARLFGYNCAYLGKIFKEKHGVSYRVYLDNLRIKHAKALMKDSSVKLHDVALKVGYSSSDYFYLKFKKITGESPAEFRKKIRG